MASSRNFIFSNHISSVDEEVITPVLHRLTSSTDLPVLLVAGQPIGSIQTIRDLHSSGQLRKILTTSSVVIDGVKRKKGKRLSRLQRLLFGSFASGLDTLKREQRLGNDLMLNLEEIITGLKR